MGTITQEITRIQGAKSDLATSITNKGVTVPAATKIDGYAALVDQIQQGGGQENEFMQSTDLTYIFAGKDLNDSKNIAGLQRFSQNNITNINNTFANSRDDETSNSNVINYISQILSKNTLVSAEYAFSYFSTYNSNLYDKILDMTDSKITGSVMYMFDHTGNSNGSLKVKIKSDTFDSATNCKGLFNITYANLSVQLNENKLYFRNTTDVSYSLRLQNTNIPFTDYSGNPIKELDIYLKSDSGNNISSMFNLKNMERIHFKSGAINGATEAFNINGIKSIDGLDFSKMSNTTGNIFNTYNNSYYANLGEFGIVNGSTLGRAQAANALNLKPIWRQSQSYIIDGQTVGYWYEKFANALGNAEITGQTITINTTLYNSLTAVQKQLITDKGYTLAYAS